MADRRIRELAPGEEENPSMMADETGEDSERIFEMIANQTKLRDRDIEALMPVDQDVVIDVSNQSTDTLHHSATDDHRKDSTHDATGTGTATDQSADSIAIAEEDEELMDLLEQPSSHEEEKKKSSPRVSPAPSMKQSTFKTTRSSPPPRPAAAAVSSPPSTKPSPKAAAPAPKTPAEAYAERKSKEELDREKEEAEKRDLLMRFYEFEEAGIPCPTRFTLKSNLQEMRFEFKKLDDEFNRKQAIKMWKDGIKLISNVVEVMNKKFDPIGWKANDFSDNLNMKLSEADWCLREIHKKYFRRGGKPSPEIMLAFMIGSTAVDTHKTNVKKEEQRQQKTAQHAPPAGYFYPPPPPHGYPPYPPQFYGWPPGAARPPYPPPQYQQQQPPRPGQQPNPQQQPQPRQQQMPQQQQQQQRPIVTSPPGSIPGTNPLAQPTQRQMPDVSRVATPVPAPMPEPTSEAPSQQQQAPPATNRRRFIPPPSSSGLGDLADMSKLVSGLASSTGPAPTRRTSNYSSNPDQQPADDQDEEEEQPKSPSSRRSGPLEPPKSTNPATIRFENGEMIFE